MNAYTRPIAAIHMAAGRPALDFVNTIHDRGADPLEDYLVDQAAWVEWAVRARVLTRAERGRLARAGEGSAALMPRLRLLREQLHALFAARIRGQTPPRDAVAALDSWVHRCWRRRVLRATRDTLTWVDATVDYELPARRLALDAVSVLETVPRERLKRCAASDGCGWLFMDDTRNNSRAWCDMNTCGAIAKMRRYRARTLHRA